MRGKTYRRVDRRTRHVHPMICCSSGLGREPELWGTGSVENYELALEEDIAEDGEANAGIRLNAPEALCKQLSENVR